MAVSGAKLTEMPLRSTILLTSNSSSFHLRFFFYATPKFTLSHPKPFSSLRTTTGNPRTNKNHYPWDENPTKNPNPGSPLKPSSASWLNKWPPSNPPVESASNPAEDQAEIRCFDGKSRAGPAGTNAIERIVLRLRNLGLGSEEEEENEGGEDSAMLVTGEEKLGDLLRRDWVRPDKMLVEESEESVFPWERVEEREIVEEVKKRRTAKAPTLAELTIEDAELRRLRRLGMTMRERITIPKAGVTGAVLEKIHEQWRKSELVRLKFHETLAHDMKTAHEIVERRTGGLVIWQSGSVMMVFRGSNYEGLSQQPKLVDREDDSLFVPDVSYANNTINATVNDSPTNMEKSKMLTSDRVESMTEEEAEYNSLLDGLGPRFEDWWGTGILPVDADLLPLTISGYKTPFRLLPTGMRSRLTNAELTNLRKLAKSLPCHFALGRNRNHQGLAAAIIQLWEKSLVVKIAVKRGIQNTNNKLMAEEIKNLTGGVLLLRNKYFIVIYRGKDFLPASVAATLAERQEMTKQIQDVEEKVRNRTVEASSMVEDGIQDVEEKVRNRTVETSFMVEEGIEDEEEKVQNGTVEASCMVEEGIEDEEEKVQNGTVEASCMVEDGQAQAGTLAEFYEAQARWGREMSAEERERMIEAASRTEHSRAVKRMEHKLSIAQTKLLRAEKMLAKLEASMVPVGPSDDQETITEEERSMFRRVGLRMKPYLPVGIRGVFDGVIENMHLHWKHRELVKLISKQKNLAFVEETARLLEHESGGILVAIERVPKGHALIFYRGKNYQRPISLRPRNLLTKAKALKRSVGRQRHEALTQHISELEKTIVHMKIEIGDCTDVQDENAWKNSDKLDRVSEFSEGEDETSRIGSDGDQDHFDWEDEESKSLSLPNNDHPSDRKS